MSDASDNLAGEIREAAKAISKTAQDQRCYSVIQSTVAAALDHLTAQAGNVEKTARITELEAEAQLVPAPMVDIAAITREVAELPDRTSPEDQPDMMLVTADELAAIISAYAIDKPARIAELEAEVARLKAKYMPGMTDLMVPPETLDANPLPVPPDRERLKEIARDVIADAIAADAEDDGPLLHGIIEALAAVQAEAALSGEKT